MIKRYKSSFGRVSIDPTQLTFVVGNLISSGGPHPTFTTYEGEVSNVEISNVIFQSGPMGGYSFDYFFDAEESTTFAVKSTQGMPTTLVQGAFNAEEAPTPFISTWRTTTENETIYLPLTGSYNLVVDWGDGTNEIGSFTFNTEGNVVPSQETMAHTYATAGDYTITISGTMDGWSFSKIPTSVSKIISISQWGCLKLSNNGFQFSNCSNLTLTNVSDVLDLTGITNLNAMFNNCSSLISINRIGEWNVTNVTYMGSMFASATSFNVDISGWNVANVTNMSGMFFNATSFNIDISSWNVSNVNNISGFMNGKSNADYSYYDNLLNSWSQLTLKSTDSKGNPIVLEMGTIQYTSSGQVARQSIIDTYGWVINDGGLLGGTTTTTTTTTTEAPTTTTTTTKDPLTYFNGVSLYSISDSEKDGTHFYNFTIDPKVLILQNMYNGQLVNAGGNKRVVVIACPIGQSNITPNFDHVDIIPWGLSPYSLSIVREGYLNTFNTYDVVFKMCEFQIVNDNWLFVKTIGEFSQSFSLEPTTTTTTTEDQTTTTTTTEEPTTTTTTTTGSTPTFITSKSIGESINIYVQTSTGYWKYNHDGVDSGVFEDTTGRSAITVQVTNSNGEFTIISCDSVGNISGDVTYLDLGGNSLTSFNGTGLVSLTTLYLYENSLTSFNGTGLGSLTQLELEGNLLTSFNVTGLGSLTYLGLNNNSLTSFNGTPLVSLTNLGLAGNSLTSLENFIFPSSLTRLGLSSSKRRNNYISSFDPSGLPNLTQLYLAGNPMTPESNDFILDKLEAAGLSNGYFQTENGRTIAGDSDFISLQSRGWGLQGVGGEPETTTTTTTTIKVSDYSLTFRKMGSNPKNAPLTIAEFEGNFGYIADYVSYLLSTLNTTDNRIAELENNISGLINRIAAIDGGEGSGGSTF